MDQDGFSSIDTDSPHFHSLKKGCQIYDIWRTYNRQYKACTLRHCKTHKVNIGRSGWTIGMWGGTPSPNYRDEERYNYRGNLKHGGHSGTRYRDRPRNKRKRINEN